MDLKKIGVDVMLALDRDHWRALVNVALNLSYNPHNLKTLEREITNHNVKNKATFDCKDFTV